MPSLAINATSSAPCHSWASFGVQRERDGLLRDYSSEMCEIGLPSVYRDVGVGCPAIRHFPAGSASTTGRVYERKLGQIWCRNGWRGIQSPTHISGPPVGCRGSSVSNLSSFGVGRRPRCKREAKNRKAPSYERGVDADDLEEEVGSASHLDASFAVVRDLANGGELVALARNGEFLGAKRNTLTDVENYNSTDEFVIGHAEANGKAIFASEENLEDWGPGDGEEIRGERGWDSSRPTTAVEGTTVGLEVDDSRRFRLRNGREVYEERAYIVGVDRKGAGGRALFGIEDSLEELTQLADTAGLAVVGSTYQKLENPNPKTYIGGGKVAELKAAIQAFKVETVIFDDELSPGQARNLEKAFGDVRVCDRTALILDIFSQRAATREATLQVELAQFEYQLPRLTKMWTHLERQAGGMVKGMGEKQIEVDKRILRTRIAALRKELESVREHRQQYRDRRAAVPIPVISLVGYTNAGKSTFLNRLSGANVLAEDRLFATLDPTTRRVELPNGKECLFTDTVGFIQKLPTQLVAAFRATLEEITDSSLMVHLVDISHPMAAQQVEAVESVLAELDVNDIPILTVWNKIDRAEDPEYWRGRAAGRDDVVCISALTGEGMADFYDTVERRIKDLMVSIEAVVPYGQGDLINTIYRLGIVDHEEYTADGTWIRAYVPLALSRQLLPLRKAYM